MTGLGQDLRFALRSFRRSPGFVAVALVTLALGVGASTAIFTVVNAVLLRPLPYHEPDRLVTVLHNRGGWPVAPATFLEWRRDNHVFAAIGAAQAWGGVLAGAESEAVRGHRVTADLLGVLGVNPALGRSFAAGDDLPGAARTVVLSHRLWQRRFAGDRGLVGRSIVLDQTPHRVIGVMPPGFSFAPFWARDVDLWLPLALAGGAADRDGQSLRVFARLADGVGLAAAQAEMKALFARQKAAHPESTRGLEVMVDRLHDRAVGKVAAPLYLLLAGVSLVLFIACANIANLLLARATTRRREMAIRASLGAGRARVVRQLCTESLLLALVGGALGGALASVAVDALVAIAPASLPRTDNIALDGRVLGFALTLSLLCGVGFGLAPALSLARVGLGQALRAAGRGLAEGGRGRLPNALVVLEVALALVLLIGAGLLARSFLALRAVDPGFDPTHVFSLVVPQPQVTAGEAGAAAPERAPDAARVSFYRALAARVEAVPGVAAVGAINHLPINGDLWSRSFAVEGETPPVPRTAVYRVATPGYLRALGLTLRAGRDFHAGEGPGSAGVAIVNEAFVRRVFPNQNPLGKRIRIQDGGPDPREIVGVVADAQQRDWAAPLGPEVYLAYLQNPPARYLTLVVRTHGERPGLADAIAAAAWRPGQPRPKVERMTEVVAAALGEPRFNLTLFNLFGALALLLAAVGVYGVMATFVGRRTQEIGVRIALGARAGDVRRLVLGQGLRLVAFGVALGLAAALVATRAMQAMLYGVTATDPATFVVIPVVIALAAGLASYLPARRATRVDPMIALRAE